MTDKNVSESRKDRLVNKLRSSTGIQLEHLTDEEILSRTKDTHLRASIELQIAVEDFSKAVKLDFKHTKDDFIKAFSKLKTKF